jgi:hypothetical protein
MMSLTAYQVSIPVMIRGLSVLDDYLGHAQALASSNGLAHEAVLGARLAPDMLNFSEQIGVLCNKVERHAARLAAQDPPAPAKVPSDFAGLRARLAQATRFVEALPEESVLNAEVHTFELSDPLIRGWFGGTEYLLELVLPDFFFHVAMAHAILRHLGAPIGKRDYLGRLGLQHGGYT